MSYFKEDEHYISFMESLEKPGYFMMKSMGEKQAKENYEKFTRTGRYDETNMEIGYGYIELPVAKPFTLKLPTDSSRLCELFVWYLQGNKVIDHKPIPGAQNWGWYKFSEEINIEKWINDFHEVQKREQQELQKANRNGMQTALF